MSADEDKVFRRAVELARLEVGLEYDPPRNGPDYVSLHPICWVEYRGMLCDRRFGHDGDHVDINGPLPGHTWPQARQAP